MAMICIKEMTTMRSLRVKKTINTLVSTAKALV
jgi:hypothetical protein